MFRTVSRLAMVAAAGAAMFAASPASAYYLITYMDQSGNVIGQDVGCESGMYYRGWGQQSSYYTVTYEGEPVC